MIPILVASNSGHAGRTFVSLGLGLRLIERGFSVGYLKPVGRTPIRKDGAVYDADALFMGEALGLADPPGTLSPFVETFETQTMLFSGAVADARANVRAAFDSLKKRDFVIIGGPGDLFEGSLLGVDALALARDLNARVLLAEAWRGEASADALFGARALFGERFCGGVINKAPVAVMSHVKDIVVPFLEKHNAPVFGVFNRDRMLESVTVRQLTDLLNGRVLCCEDRLDEFVENFSIGAMDVDSALAYFRRLANKAVITGAHRADIQLAALETSTRCIILTGGLLSNDVVIGKAQAKNIPIISVSDDTFTTIEKIELRAGTASIREQRKVDRVREMMATGFDLDRFLKKVGA
jgi:BioD-like phosphotransacetylase family protein